MAEGFLKSLDTKLDVFSAGTHPGDKVHPLAVKVMSDIGIDINEKFPIHVNEFLNDHFDYVITVCSGAKEKCPVFTGSVKQTIHIGFDDPAEAEGTEEFILSEFIRIRNEITVDFQNFYNDKIKAEL